MPAQSRPKVIGFCATVWQEVANARLAGVVSYVDEHPDELAIRDFRYQKQYGDKELALSPPWAGVADGVVACFGVDGSVSEIVEWLDRGGAPVVSLVRDWRHPKIPIVDTDSGAAMRMAADYFVEKGYESYAFVGEGISKKGTLTRRKQFADRLAKHDFTPLAYDLSFIADGSTDDIDRVASDHGLVQFLAEAPKPLAIVALTDSYARAICVLCEKMNVDVPSEVAILGSGNFTASRCHSPTLSTIKTRNEQIGYEAARILHARMNGLQVSTRPKLLRPERIIERQSTAGLKPRQDNVKAACDFIEKYACDGVTVHDVVRGLALSRRSLETRFVERTGTTPKQMIQRIRLDRAKHLLRRTGLSVTQIAMMTGFGDVAAFTNFIRKQTGSAPTKWRERATNGHDARQ